MNHKRNQKWLEKQTSFSSSLPISNSPLTRRRLLWNQGKCVMMFFFLLWNLSAAFVYPRFRFVPVVPKVWSANSYGFWYLYSNGWFDWFEMIYWLKFIIHIIHMNTNIKKSIRTTITKWLWRVQAIYSNKSWASLTSYCRTSHITWYQWYYYVKQSFCWYWIRFVGPNIRTGMGPLNFKLMWDSICRSNWIIFRKKTDRELDDDK
jgi:hypothetical protein